MKERFSLIVNSIAFYFIFINFILFIDTKRIRLGIVWGLINIWKDKNFREIWLVKSLILNQ